MFTGIIEHQGFVQPRSPSRLRLKAEKKLITRLTLGASIAVNGVCLTVSELTSSITFEVDILPETLRVTTLGKLKPDSAVNLELPVSANGLLGGHLVQGHVDGTATISAIARMGDNHLITLTAGQDLTRYMVKKGSVALNGISLTVIDAGDESFSVGIIPHTWDHTMLRDVSAGDQVNIEIDILARYIEKLTRKKERVSMVKKLPAQQLDFRIALIAARWHEDLVNVATDSCYRELSKLGVIVDSNVQLFKVPGSLEIPLIAKRIIKTGDWDAVIAFGLVVDGGIYRHEFVAQAVLNGIMSIALETEVPVLSAVLTPQEFDEHDSARIEFFREHLVTKGIEAARAAVQTIQAARLV